MSDPIQDAGWRHHLIRITGAASAMLLAGALLAVAMADRGTGDAPGMAGAPSAVNLSIESDARGG